MSVHQVPLPAVECGVAAQFFEQTGMDTTPSSYVLLPDVPSHAFSLDRSLTQLAQDPLVMIFLSDHAGQRRLVMISLSDHGGQCCAGCCWLQK